MKYLIRFPYLSIIFVLIFSSLYFYVTHINNHDLLIVYYINIPAIILSILLAVTFEFRRDSWFLLMFPIVFLIMPLTTLIYFQNDDFRIIFYILFVFNIISVLLYLYFLILNRSFIKSSNKSVIKNNYP